ncbi:MAG: CDP-alcohol phosphatidyltransferase family protein [Acidimicrobiales bacterium]
MLDGRWRVGVSRATVPASAALRRTGVTPDQLTGLGLVLAAGAGVAIAVGDLTAGAVLIGFCGLADLLDGPLAKAAGSASLRGAFFDSVADRLSDVFLLAGVAWYLASTRGPHLAVLALGVLGASMLPSYVRAKADTLGLAARGGIMERAERMIVLGVAIFIQAYLPAVPVLVPVLWLILALSLLTAGQRFSSAWRQAPLPAAAGPSGTTGTGAGTGAGTGVGTGVGTGAGTGAGRAPAMAGARSARVIRTSPGPSRESRPRPHMRGGSSRRPGEPAMWRSERSHGPGAAGRPARPAKQGPRRQGWGGEDPGT